MYKVRLSNFELLRIVCMLMICLLHAHTFVSGNPTKTEIVNSPLPSLFRVFIYYLTIVSVGVFVLISGWFGIRFSLKKLSSLLFQVLFFVVVGGIICFDQLQHLSIGGILGAFVMGNSEYWFIKVYLLLMLFIPIINSFIENTCKKQLEFVLLGGFAFLFFYGWVFPDSTDWILHGYSFPCFVYLYILGRYLRLYPNRLTLCKCHNYMFIYLGLGMISTFFELFLISRNIDFKGRQHFYFSPIIILMSVSLLLMFSKIKIQNKFINWVSISSLSVYLFHNHFLFFEKIYQPVILNLWIKNSYLIYVVKLFLFCIFIFIISVLLDKIRISLFKLFLKTINIRL